MLRAIRKLLHAESPAQDKDITVWINPPETSAEEVFLTAAGRFLEVQISTYHAFDNRSGATVAAGSIILPVTFGLVGLSTRDVPISSVVILGLALLCYAALLFCAYKASQIWAFDYRPKLRTLYRNSELVSGESLRRWVGVEYVESTEYNAPHLERKGLWVGRSIIALCAQGFLLALAAGLTFLLSVV